MSKPKADQITVRLGDDDRAVLSWLTDYVRATVGAGIDVRDSDAVRWALHTCKAGLCQSGDDSQHQIGGA